MVEVYGGERILKDVKKLTNNDCCQFLSTRRMRITDFMLCCIGSWKQESSSGYYLLYLETSGKIQFESIC